MNHRSLLAPVSFCEHLSLIPEDDEKEHIEALIWEIKQPGNTAQEIVDYFIEMLGEDMMNFFKPWCNKQNNFCVIIESVVIDQYNPLFIMLNNIQRLEECPHRSFPTGKRYKTLHTWLVDTIKTK